MSLEAILAFVILFGALIVFITEIYPIDFVAFTIMALILVLGLPARRVALAVLAAVMAGFGGVISEVGASMMVGGNIRDQTRVLTTATVLETGKGNFEVAIALGLILLALTFARVPRLPEQPEVWTAAQFIGGFLLCPLLILTVIQRGYLFARRQHWTGRRKGEAEQVRDLQIPLAVRRPETFDGVICRQVVEHNDRDVSAQRDLARCHELAAEVA